MSDIWAETNQSVELVLEAQVQWENSLGVNNLPFGGNRIAVHAAYTTTEDAVQDNEPLTELEGAIAAGTRIESDAGFSEFTDEIMAEGQTPDGWQILWSSIPERTSQQVPSNPAHLITFERPTGSRREIEAWLEERGQVAEVDDHREMSFTTDLSVDPLVVTHRTPGRAMHLAISSGTINPIDEPEREVKVVCRFSTSGSIESIELHPDAQIEELVGLQTRLKYSKEIIPPQPAGGSGGEGCLPTGCLPLPRLPGLRWPNVSAPQVRKPNLPHPHLNKPSLPGIPGRPELSSGFIPTMPWKWIAGAALVAAVLPCWDRPDLPNLPNLPTVSAFGGDVDLPDLPNLPNLYKTPCYRPSWNHVSRPDSRTVGACEIVGAETTDTSERILEASPDTITEDLVNRGITREQIKHYTEVRNTLAELAETLEGLDLDEDELLAANATKVLLEVSPVLARQDDSELTDIITVIAAQKLGNYETPIADDLRAEELADDKTGVYVDAKCELIIPGTSITVSSPAEVRRELTRAQLVSVLEELGFTDPTLAKDYADVLTAFNKLAPASGGQQSSRDWMLPPYPED